jgi:sec-independent protein translocase protein TatB
MFNIGFSELILILLVAFLVVGPRDLPKVARSLGRFVRFLKTKWAEFLSETELDDTISEFQTAQKEIRQSVKDASPVNEIKKAEAETRAAFREMNGSTGLPDEKEKKE